MGFFNRSTKASEDLIENGIHGRATVEKAKMGQLIEYSGFMREKTMEKLVSGETSMTKYKLDLRVSIPGRSTYPAHISVSVPTTKAGYMTGGSVLPVLVDPNQPDRINVDWDGQFERGTLAQMADANPLVAAAMRGAGVDVEAISRQQEAQKAAGQTHGVVIMGGQLVNAPAGTAAPDPLDQLTKLGELRDRGLLTEEEFQAQKAKLLG